MTKRLIAVILIGVLMLGLMAGCSSVGNTPVGVSADDKIIGAWTFMPYQNVDSDNEYFDEERKTRICTAYFFSDGTATNDFSGMEMDEWGYMAKEDIYRFTSEGKKHNYFKITFSGDKMIMTRYGYFEEEEYRGDSMEFTRVEAS